MILYDGIEWNVSESGYYNKRINGEKWQLHRYVYSKEGRLPIMKGWCVHHIDFNKENNSIDNLVLMFKNCHHSLHGRNISDETRRKISISGKGKIISEKQKAAISTYNKNKIVSLETRRKMSISKKNISDETRRKMSRAKKGIALSDEHKNKIGLSSIGRGIKSVRCIETDKVFKSITEAANFYNILRSGISSCLTGRSNICGGFHWEYV